MPKALTANGAWSWFADPRAVHSAGRIYTGWVDMQARVWVAQILDDRAAGYPVRRFLLSDRAVVGPEDVLADDHANPVILVRGGRVVAFWSLRCVCGAPRVAMEDPHLRSGASCRT